MYCTITVYEIHDYLFIYVDGYTDHLLFTQNRMDSHVQVKLERSFSL
jgi:hypothetical protein